jgi:hypothetical protein
VRFRAAIFLESTYTQERASKLAGDAERLIQLGSVDRGCCLEQAGETPEFRDGARGAGPVMTCLATGDATR